MGNIYRSYDAWGNALDKQGNIIEKAAKMERAKEAMASAAATASAAAKPSVPHKPKPVTKKPVVTKKPAAVTKKRGRPKTGAMTPAEKQRAYRDRKKETK